MSFLFFKVKLTTHGGSYGNYSYIWSSLSLVPSEFVWDRLFSDTAAPIGEYPVSVEAWDNVGNRGINTGMILIPEPGPPVESPTATPLAANAPPSQPQYPTATDASEAISSGPEPSPTARTVVAMSFGIEDDSDEAPGAIDTAVITTAPEGGSSGLLWGAAALALAGSATSYALQRRKARAEALAKKRRQAARESSPAARKSRLQRLWQQAQAKAAPIRAALLAAAAAAAAMAHEAQKQRSKRLKRKTAIDPDMNEEALKELASHLKAEDYLAATGKYDKLVPPSAETMAAVGQTASPVEVEQHSLPSTLTGTPTPKPTSTATPQPYPQVIPTLSLSSTPIPVPPSNEIHLPDNLSELIPSLGLIEGELKQPIINIGLIEAGRQSSWHTGIINNPVLRYTSTKMEFSIGPISIEMGWEGNTFEVGLSTPNRVYDVDGQGTNMTVRQSGALSIEWNGWHTTSTVHYNSYDLTISGSSQTGVYGSRSEGIYFREKPIQAIVAGFVIVGTAFVAINVQPLAQDLMNAMHKLFEPIPIP